jgi:hypothetical protein
MPYKYFLFLCLFVVFPLSTSVATGPRPSFRPARCAEVLSSFGGAKIDWREENKGAYFELPTGFIWNDAQAEQVRLKVNAFSRRITNEINGDGGKGMLVTSPGEFATYDNLSLRIDGGSIRPSEPTIAPERQLLPYTSVLGRDLALPLNQYLLQHRAWILESVRSTFGKVGRAVWVTTLRTEKGLRITEGHVHRRQLVTLVHAEINRSSEFANGKIPPDDSASVFTTQWHKTPDTGSEARLLVLSTLYFPELPKGGD